MSASTPLSCAPSSMPTALSPKKSATPPTARTSAIAWFPVRALFSLSPTPANPTTSLPCSSPTILARKKSTTAPCTMPGPQKTNSSTAAYSPKSPSISSPTPNPSASTNPAPPPSPPQVDHAHLLQRPGRNLPSLHGRTRPAPRSPSRTHSLHRPPVLHPRRHHHPHLHRRLPLLRHQGLARLPQHLPPHLSE